MYKYISLCYRYPGNLLALVIVPAYSSINGFYILAYNNTVDNQLLASFNPSGNCCCFNLHGQLCFFTNATYLAYMQENTNYLQTVKWKQFSKATINVQVRFTL